MGKAMAKRMKAIETPSDLPPRRAKAIIFQIRMTPEALDRINEIADRKELAASALARMWLLERLAQERKRLDPPSKYPEWV